MTYFDKHLSKARGRIGTAASRRQTERLPVSVSISISAPGWAKARTEQTRTVDLSRGGASFTARRAYHTGMDLGVSFLELQNLPARTRKLSAQVVRVSRPSPGDEAAVAVRFGNRDLANLIFGELLRSRIRISSALLGVIQALSPGAETEAVIENICRATRQAMEAESVLLFLHDSKQNVLRARPCVADRVHDIQIGIGQGVVGKAAKSGRLINAASSSADARYRPKPVKAWGEGARSLLCVPLSKENGISPGVLVILNKRYGPFTREDEGMSLAVANQISIVLREARLFEEIRNMKNYYERVLECIATGILTFDRDGKLATINRAGAEIFGFRASRDVGQDFQMLLAGTANARIASLTDEVLTRHRGGTAFDVRFLGRGGQSLSLDVRALPLKDMKGNSLGGILVAEDISQEQRLMSTLCRYMAREVVDHVLQDKGGLKLGGRRTEVTILMTDIRNFTTISEQLNPWEVVNLLNAYFPRLINVIFRHQGMVDKFIGDAILAVFGVPEPRPDDALRAVRAALEIRRELRAINRERARKRQRTIEMGIGITSGTVISGNIGSERRMDYTVIGDSVNLAARLEGLTKQVQRRILVNERVQAAIGNGIPCEALGLFEIKGKREKVPVFAVKTPGEDS